MHRENGQGVFVYILDFDVWGLPLNSGEGQNNQYIFLLLRESVQADPWMFRQKANNFICY